MLALLRSNLALLFGIALLMTGHGLQSTLLGLRTAIEQFSTMTSGLVLAGYFLGLLVGSLRAPLLIVRVGHVRVFAAMSAIASTTILFHLLVVDPVSWFLFRFVTGFCLAGVYVVAESWLNAGTPNAMRGRLLSVYLLLQNAGLAGGPLLLNLAAPGDFQPFVLVSVLVSLAVVPMLLSAVPAPPIAAGRRFTLRDLWRVSPLGFVGICGIGIVQGALWSLGPIFARQIGLDLAGVTGLMAIIAVGGVALQWPFGRLSDQFDRRHVLIVACLAAAIVLLPLPLLGSPGRAFTFAAFFLFAGLALPVYSVCVAHINDFLEAEEMVAASGALLLANGAGAVAGPLLAAALMSGLGAPGFPLLLALVMLGIGGFALYRLTVRPPVPSEERGQFVALPQLSPVALELAQEQASEQGVASEGADSSASPQASR